MILLLSFVFISHSIDVVGFFFGTTGVGSNLLCNCPQLPCQSCPTCPPSPPCQPVVCEPTPVCLPQPQHVYAPLPPKLERMVPCSMLNYESMQHDGNQFEQTDDEFPTNAEEEEEYEEEEEVSLFRNMI